MKHSLYQSYIPIWARWQDIRTLYSAIGELNVVSLPNLDWLVTVFQSMLGQSLAGNYPTPAATMEYKPDRTRVIQPLAKISASVDVLFNFRFDIPTWCVLGGSPPAIEA